MRTSITKFLLILEIVSAARAQSFNSGSSGADGPLVLTTPGTIAFEPGAFNPAMNPARENIYHFTSVYIAKGVTIKLSSRTLSSPVFWLSQGPVEIDGTIDLSGVDGGGGPSLAGAGGYAGGAIGKPGYGPAGFTPNVFLVPLVGGFGGDGGDTRSGGAGGGALLIASSTSITVNGSIIADGGNSRDGIGGGGGAIRLVAPIISGTTGSLSARGGQTQGNDGRIRFEAFDNQFAGSLNSTPVAVGKPLGLFLPPTPLAFVRLVSIGGVAVTAPDFTLNQSTPVAVVIEARFIPLGTVLQLEYYSEAGSGQTIATTPLEGKFELSRATASVTFPTGSTHIHMKAAWKQPDRSPQLQ